MILCHFYTPLHSMLTELLYPLQWGDTPFHSAAKGGNTTCVERLLSFDPCIDVNIQNRVSWSILNDQVIIVCMVLNTIL